MPRTGNYSITIEVKGDIEKKQSPISGDKTQSDTEKSSGILNKEQAQAFRKGLVAYHYGKAFTDQIISHKVSTVELRTGSKDLQDRANLMLDVSQKLVGAGESVFTGLMVGGGMGALVGLVTNLLHTAISYSQKQQVLNMQETLENRSIQTTFIRAGANGSRRQW